MPDWKQEIREQLAGLRLGPERENEIVEELSEHLEDRYEELLSTGVAEEEAYRAVFAELSDSRSLARELRRIELTVRHEPIALGEGRRNMIEDLWRDLRYGIRTLRKHKGFTAVAVLTLALGIGANTAIFSVVDAILLTPLPFHESERLVIMNEASLQSEEFSVSWLNFLDWRDRAQSFEDVGGSAAGSFNMMGLEQPLRLSGRRVTSNLLKVLGVQPQLGRAFTAEDDRFEAAPTALISEALWKGAFGADPQILDRTIILDGASYNIIGVLPPDFEFLRREDVWVPLGLVVRPQSSLMFRGNHQGLYPIARLKPGVTLEQAQAEMRGIAAQLESEYPDSNSGNTAVVKLLRARVVQEVQPVLLVLMGAVGFVLLIVCVNVANLLLARAASRRQEIAVRLALGARRGRIVQQLLTESLLLAAIGGLAGVLIGKWTLGVLVSLAPPDVPRLGRVQLDGEVLAFAAAITLLTGLLFGLLPAWYAARVDLITDLKQTGRSSGLGALRRRVFNSLLVIEVGLALVLLAGAGLMIRTVKELIEVDPGFSVERLLTMKLNLTGPKYREPSSRQSFYNAALSSIESAPGVVSAALAQSVPIQGSEWNSIFIVDDRPVPDRAHLPNAAYNPVSAGYFHTLGIRLVRGRLFAESDTEGSPYVTVVNETFARHFWPDQDPIGKRLKQGFPEWTTPWREIVGVVADVKLEGVNKETPMQAYLPLAQNPSSSLNLVVRTKADPMVAAADVQAAIHTADPDLPLFQIRSMDELFERSILPQRAAMILLGSFAALAMLLAAVGIYGVISYGVIQRTREIGLRLALGAEPRQVLWLILRQGMWLTLAGVGLGLIGALILTRAMSALLFRVSSADPITFVGVPLIVIAVVLMACYIPARRATRVDPMVALRYE